MSSNYTTKTDWADRPALRATVSQLSGNTTTDIDRRKCQRVVPMEVLGLGLSRTGTSSLRQALIDLGYDDCYHFATPLIENPPDAEMWSEAMEAKFEGRGKEFRKMEWDALLGHCRAITDTPCTVFYEELLAAYPDAKVILTVRDTSEEWQSSVCKTLMENWFEVHYKPTKTIWERIYRAFLPVTPMYRLCVLLERYYMYGFVRERGREFYQEYNSEIKKIVPRERLLVFNVKEGWEPLCRFLDKDVPPWEFPRGNDREGFVRALDIYNAQIHAGVRRRIWKTAGLAMVAVAGLWYVCNQIRSASL